MNAEITSYESDALVDAVYRKTVACMGTLHQREADDPALLLALVGLATVRPIRVLDLGGACGLHYFQATAWTSLTYDWWVVETPAMVRRAHPSLGSGSLHFVTDISTVERPDIVFASGAIQYAVDAFGLLRRVLSTGAVRVVISRFPLHEGHEPLTRIQRCWLSDNGPGPLPPDIKDRRVSLPLWILPRANVEMGFEVAGYAIKATWPDPSGSVEQYEGHAYILERQ